jgi:hypothetical protein
MKKWLVPILVPVVTAGAVLALILFLGQRAWEDLRQQGTYRVAFAEIECTPPDGLSRVSFLNEVQYLEGLPEELPLLNPQLSEQLSHAFAAHPWVERVRGVEINPPRQIRVDLVYRTPVLSVSLSPARDPQGLPRTRAVDRHGVLLPLVHRQEPLPLFITPVDLPEEGPGKRWGDERVQAAAATLALLRPHLAGLGLADCQVEVKEEGIHLHTGQVHLLWGNPPGKEAPEEPPAATKLAYLKQRQEKESKTSTTLDLRHLPTP